MSTMHRFVLVTCVSAGMISAAYAETPAVPVNATVAAPITQTVSDPVPVKRPILLRHRVASHLRPHDVAHPVARVAQAEAHELASPGISRTGVTSLGLQRVAVLERHNASCDSILCPGYAMLGVGF